MEDKEVKEYDFKDLKPEWRVFAENYVIDWDATKAYMKAYSSSNYEGSKASASRLLTNVNLKAYIEHIQNNLAKLCGISAARNILELKKIAFTNITDFKKGWMTEKDFDELTEDQKAALSEIQYIDKDTQFGSEKIVKFKLHDKQKAIDMLNKMLGYDAVIKTDLTSQGDKIQTIVGMNVK